MQSECIIALLIACGVEQRDARFSQPLNEQFYRGARWLPGKLRLVNRNELPPRRRIGMEPPAQVIAWRNVFQPEIHARPLF